jgi:hypothetical protein
MSSKVISVVGAVLFGVVLLATTTQGCGGGSSGGNPRVTCEKSCDKIAECTGFTQGVAQCKSNCAQTASGGATGTQNACPGMTAAQLSAKADTCLAMSCDVLLDCLANICPTATGAGGATGAAGRSATGAAGSTTGAAGFAFDGSIPGFDGGFVGAAGSAGSTCATACTKADTCCKAFPGANPADCTYKADCDAASDMASEVMVCNLFLQTSAVLGASQPAACK